LVNFKGKKNISKFPTKTTLIFEYLMLFERPIYVLRVRSLKN